MISLPKLPKPPARSMAQDEAAVMAFVSVFIILAARTGSGGRHPTSVTAEVGSENEQP